MSGSSSGTGNVLNATSSILSCPGPTSSCISRPSRMSPVRSSTTAFFSSPNVLGTQVVARLGFAQRDRVELFVHISTSEVYGTATSAMMDEDHPLNPMSPYSAAKCGADRLVYSYWSTIAFLL